MYRLTYVQLLEYWSTLEVSYRIPRVSKIASVSSFPISTTIADPSSLTQRTRQPPLPSPKLTPDQTMTAAHKRGRTPPRSSWTSRPSVRDLSSPDLDHHLHLHPDPYPRSHSRPQRTVSSWMRSSHSPSRLSLQLRTCLPRPNLLPRQLRPSRVDLGVGDSRRKGRGMSWIDENGINDRIMGMMRRRRRRG